MRPKGVKSEAVVAHTAKPLSLVNYYTAVFNLLASVVKRLKLRAVAFGFRKLYMKGATQAKTVMSVNTEMTKPKRLMIGCAISIIRRNLRVKNISLNLKLKLYTLVWRCLAKLPDFNQPHTNKHPKMTSNTLNLHTIDIKITKTMALNVINRFRNRLSQKDHQRIRFLFVISFYKIRSLSAKSNTEMNKIALGYLAVTFERKAAAWTSVGYHLIKNLTSDVKTRTLEAQLRLSAIKKEEVLFSHGNSEAKLKFLTARRLRNR